MRNAFIESRTGLHSGNELLVGVDAVAGFLGINGRLVGRLAKGSRLPLKRLGLHKVALKSELIAWVAGLPNCEDDDAGAS